MQKLRNFPSPSAATAAAAASLFLFITALFTYVCCWHFHQFYPISEAEGSCRRDLAEFASVDGRGRSGS